MRAGTRGRHPAAFRAFAGGGRRPRRRCRPRREVGRMTFDHRFGSRSRMLEALFDDLDETGATAHPDRRPRRLCRRLRPVAGRRPVPPPPAPRRRRPGTGGQRQQPDSSGARAAGSAAALQPPCRGERPDSTGPGRRGGQPHLRPDRVRTIRHPGQARAAPARHRAGSPSMSPSATGFGTAHLPVHLPERSGKGAGSRSTRHPAGTTGHRLQDRSWGTIKAGGPRWPKTRPRTGPTTSTGTASCAPTRTARRERVPEVVVAHRYGVPRSPRRLLAGGPATPVTRPTDDSPPTSERGSAATWGGYPSC